MNGSADTLGSADSVEVALEHYRADRLAEAEGVCRRLLLGSSFGADACHILGLIAWRVGKLDAAVICFSEAIDRVPQALPPRLNLVAVEIARGNRERAAAVLRPVIALAPDTAGHVEQRALLLVETGRGAEAMALYRRLTVLAPDMASGWRMLGLTLEWHGRLDEARQACRQAFIRGGGAAMLMREALCLPAVVRDRQEIDFIRRRFLEIMDEARQLAPPMADPLHEVGKTAFHLAYHAMDDRPLQEAMARAYAAMCPSLLETAPHCVPGAARERHADGRIHIGFVSELLFSHTIGRLNVGLIERLSRQRFHVTICAPARPADRYRARVLAVADKVVELPDDLAAARAALAAERLDILYYPDIGMMPLPYFLSFARLAPVQCMSWGHPDTTGVDTLDMFLSADCMEPDDAQAHYSETLVRLPGPTVYYERPFEGVVLKTRGELGLPEDAHLYVCPQSIFKFHPDFDPLLIEILRRDPLGRLVLVDPRGQAPALVARLARLDSEVAGRVTLRTIPSINASLSLSG
jgi:predicted O-linked N-acetylglucosamine transferase (SPINDLY family)